MSTKVRLTRIGSKGKPSFRIVVQNESEKNNGKVIENLGYYNPQTKPAEIKIDKERLSFWQKRGTIISPAVKKILA